MPAGCSKKQERRFLSLGIVGPPGGPSERQVSASINGYVGDPHKIDQRDDAAVITFVGGKLVVEKARITLDGKEIALVPEGAKKVRLDFIVGKLTGTAVWAIVLEMQIGK
jgi:hypothetical protein